MVLGGLALNSGGQMGDSGLREDTFRIRLASWCGFLQESRAWLAGFPRAAVAFALAVKVPRL